MKERKCLSLEPKEKWKMRKKIISFLFKQDNHKIKTREREREVFLQKKKKVSKQFSFSVKQIHGGS